MSIAILFIYLREDQTNDVEVLMSHIEKREHKYFFSHGGVVRLAQNAFVFEETTAHGRLAILCSEAQKKEHAYLLLRLDPDSSLLAGKPSKDIQDILQKIGVPYCPPLSETS